MALNWDFLASALRLGVFLLHLHALFQNVSPLDVTQIQVYTDFS